MLLIPFNSPAMIYQMVLAPVLLPIAFMKPMTIHELLKVPPTIALMEPMMTYEPVTLARKLLLIAGMERVMIYELILAQTMLLIAFMNSPAMIYQMFLAPVLLSIAFMKPMTIHELILAVEMLLIAFRKHLAMIYEMVCHPAAAWAADAPRPAATGPACSAAS
jgi:hypothetical protein